ncbi:MAG: exo-alpha-sialidase [Planctomycetes bacterium]|nr:exo-alpha-sialidase [Planctomycetota bacterium]
MAQTGALRGSELEQADVFVSGRDGYHTFRIPAVLLTPGGTLLAFCEGRKKGTSDTGDIDLVLRRSRDGGKSWGALETVWDDGPNTIGNPCPLVDASTGTIWLPLTRNLGEDSEEEILSGTAKGSREAWITRSDDDGATWAKPAEITKAVKGPDWTWYATGPGCGIQLRSGRLLVPCDHAVARTKMRRSHVIYSDDRGATWRLGGVLGDLTNECQVVERADGSLLLNMRSYHGKSRRAVATSRDGGLTWTEPALDLALVEPVCQASLIRLRDGALLFSNPASTKREKMTVRLSRDEGKSWPGSRLLHGGRAAYSALTPLPGGGIGCLYERGEKSPYETITFARFSLGWLSEGKDAGP